MTQAETQADPLDPLGALRQAVRLERARSGSLKFAVAAVARLFGLSPRRVRGVWWGEPVRLDWQEADRVRAWAREMAEAEHRAAQLRARIAAFRGQMEAWYWLKARLRFWRARVWKRKAEMRVGAAERWMDDADRARARAHQHERAANVAWITALRICRARQAGRARAGLPPRWIAAGGLVALLSVLALGLGGLAQALAWAMR